MEKKVHLILSLLIYGRFSSNLPAALYDVFYLSPLISLKLAVDNVNTHWAYAVDFFYYSIESIAIEHISNRTKWHETTRMIRLRLNYSMTTEQSDIFDMRTDVIESYVCIQWFHPHRCIGNGTFKCISIFDENFTHALDSIEIAYWIAEDGIS